MVGALCILLNGCASQSQETVAKATGALTATAVRILGFESISDWTVTGGTRTLRSEHVEGTHSIAVSAGYTQLRSVPLSGLGTVGAQVTLDLQLPTTQVNPSWFGSISLKINSPSLGINAVSLGQSELLGSPLGVFKRFTFAVPQALRTKLNGAYSDLTFTVILNVPPSAGLYLLDRLDLGQTMSPSPRACGPGGRCLVLVHLPSGVSLESAQFVAEAGITLGDRTHVVGAAGQPRLITNNGGSVDLGVNALTGDVVALGGVTLRNFAVVSGSVRALGSITVGSGAQITGQIDPNPQLRPRATRSWSISPPPIFASGVDLQPNQAQALAPGGYGDVAVKGGATLTLTTGSYYLNSLKLEAQSILRLNQTAGPIYLYVLQSIIHRGTITTTNATPPNWLVAYLGDTAATLEAPFSGTFLAANAVLTLSSVAPAAYSGAFYARQLVTGAGVQLTLLPSPLLGDLVDEELSDCAARIQLDPSLPEPLRTQQSYYDLLKFCLAPGLSDCETKLMAITNSDRRALALKYISQVIDAPEHIAVSRDISRRVHRLQKDPLKLAQYCQGDADGDRVPDALDQCPNTPPLTEVNDVGCTVHTTPVTAPRGVIDALLSRMGIVYNPKCDGAATPVTPNVNEMGLNTSGNFGSALLSVDANVSVSQLAPPGCEVWLELQIFYKSSGRHFEMAVELREDIVVVIDEGGGGRPVLFDRILTRLDSDAPGDRGQLVRDMIAAKQGPASPNGDSCMMVSARLTNGNGIQSHWSAPLALFCK